MLLRTGRLHTHMHTHARTHACTGTHTHLHPLLPFHAIRGQRKASALLGPFEPCYRDSEQLGLLTLPLAQTLKTLAGALGKGGDGGPRRFG